MSNVKVSIKNTVVKVPVENTNVVVSAKTSGPNVVSVSNPTTKVTGGSSTDVKVAASSPSNIKVAASSPSNVKVTKTEEKVVVSGRIGGALGDAPQDGVLYGRKDGSWQEAGDMKTLIYDPLGEDNDTFQLENMRGNLDGGTF